MLIEILFDIIFHRLRFVSGLIVIFIFLFLIKINCALNPQTLVLSIGALTAAILERRSWKNVESIKSLVEFEQERSKVSSSSDKLQEAIGLNRIYIGATLLLLALLFVSWLLC